MTSMILPAVLPAVVNPAACHPGSFLRLPPLWSTKLLNWHPGLKREDIVIDRKSGLGLVQSSSHAIKLDGISEVGTTATNHGTIENHSGTAVLAYDGITISTVTPDGTVCDLTFSDGTHYRLAEGSGGVSTDDTGVHTIVWSGDIASIRSGTTDDYHANANLGWWEIEGDPVKYQYPVAGFDTYHPANKLTPCETKLAYEVKPVGLFDGIVCKITLGPTVYISGDFFFSVYIDLTRDGATQYIIKDNLNNNYIRLDGTGGFLVAVAGSVGIASTVNGSVGILSLIRVGDQATLSLGDESYTYTVSTGDVEYTAISYGSTSGATGILRNPNFNGLLIPINEGVGTTLHTPSLGDLDKEQLVQWSEDIRESPWGASNVTVDTATTFTFTALYSRVFQEIITKEGILYTLKINVRAVSGNTENFHLRHEQSESGDATAFSVTDTLEGHVFTFLGKVGGGSVKIVIQDNNASGWGQFEVTSWHITTDDGLYVATENYTYKLGYGRSIGTLTTASETDFWNGAAPMVDDRIIEMEKVQGTNLWTDGKGHALPQPYSALEELGGELIGDSILDSRGGGVISLTSDGYAAESDGTSTSVIRPKLDLAVTEGDEYILKITPTVLSGACDDVRLYNGTGYVLSGIDASESIKITFTAGAGVHFLSYNGEQTFSMTAVASIREVNPIVNQNKLNYLGKNGIINLSEVATDEEDLKIKKYQGLI